MFDKRYMRLYKKFYSEDDVTKWVDKNYSSVELAILDAKNTDSSLSWYKGGGYRQMNKEIRCSHRLESGTYDNVELQELLCKYTIPENILVSRFVSIKELFYLWKNTCFHKQYQYLGFLSTTLLKEQYAMNDIKVGRLAITVLIPKGTHGVYVPEVNMSMPEYEILLPSHLFLGRIKWNVYEIEYKE